MMMRFDIMTLFPELVDRVLSESIIGRARRSGAIEVNVYNIRDYSEDKNRRVDDTPYGGGKGLLMAAPPIFNCYESVRRSVPEWESLRTRVIFVDAVARTVPGVLSAPECFESESLSDGLLEYPQYTRPYEFHGVKVPDVLISGHHANIDRWRAEKAAEMTAKMRPDLLDGKED